MTVPAPDPIDQHYSVATVTVQCGSPACVWNGIPRQVARIPAGPGIVFAFHVLCTGCGCEPMILAADPITGPLPIPAAVPPAGAVAAAVKPTTKATAAPTAAPAKPAARR